MHLCSLYWADMRHQYLMERLLLSLCKYETTLHSLINRMFTRKYLWSETIRDLHSCNLAQWSHRQYSIYIYHSVLCLQFAMFVFLVIILASQVECRGRKLNHLPQEVDAPEDLTIEQMIDLLADCKSKVYNGTYGKFLHDDSILMPEDKKLKDSDYPYPHVLKEKIRDLQKYYPWKIRVHELEDKVYGHIPSTVEGLNGTLVLEKSIQVVEVTYDFNKTKNKPGIVVFSVDSTGISIPSAMILLIYNLLEKCESKIPLLLKLNWYFIPLGNPHGFYYNTVTVPNLSKDKKPLAFRKNRRIISTKYGKCFGVNIDRNFDYHWGEGDFENGTQVATSDGVGCDEFYAGPSAFSESESVALRNFFLQKKEEVKLYIQLQTRLDNRKHASIEYPWTYTKEPPSGVQSLVEMATCAQKLIHYNTKLMFKVRQASKRLR